MGHTDTCYFPEIQIELSILFDLAPVYCKGEKHTGAVGVSHSCWEKEESRFLLPVVQEKQKEHFGLFIDSDFFVFVFVFLIAP